MNDIKDYELTAFKPSDFKDNFGNTWCDVAFLGVSEPVKWVVKDPSRYTVGQKYYGRIEDKTSKAGKPYLKFKPEKREEATTSDKGQSDEYWADKQSQIRAQWAIGQAVQLHIAVTSNGGEEAQGIEATAKELYAMVDRVKTPQEDKDYQESLAASFNQEGDINVGDLPL